MIIQFGYDLFQTETKKVRCRQLTKQKQCLVKQLFEMMVFDGNV